MTPAQIQTKLEESRLSPKIESVAKNTSTWVRPEGYPNLDILKAGIGDTESAIYLTYDLSKTPDIAWIGVYTAGATYYVARGHIANNVFVADYTSSAISGSGYFRQALDSANGNVQLWKVYSSGNLTRFGFSTNSATTAECHLNTLQPCVERVFLSFF